MARPKAFDRDEVLQAATAVFWAKGYEAASTDDLLRAMGISRQSLYDTYGGKRALYLEALARYNADSLATRIAILKGPASPLAGLSDFLTAVAAEPAEQRALGCMGINAICEFGQSEPDVTATGAAGSGALQAALEGALRAAKAQGEIAAGIDVAAAGRFLQTTLTGLKVYARSGAPSEALREIADFAVQTLKPR
jgi:TetR/AcrR family transcriptional repressor of nem operon